MLLYQRRRGGGGGGGGGGGIGGNEVSFGTRLREAEVVSEEEDDEEEEEEEEVEGVDEEEDDEEEGNGGGFGMRGALDFETSSLLQRGCCVASLSPICSLRPVPGSFGVPALWEMSVDWGRFLMFRKRFDLEEASIRPWNSI